MRQRKQRPCNVHLEFSEANLQEPFSELQHVCTCTNEVSNYQRKRKKKETLRVYLQGKYCLSKLSIFRDLVSILMIIASALSASTNSAAPAIRSISLSLSLQQDYLKTKSTHFISSFNSETHCIRKHRGFGLLIKCKTCQAPQKGHKIGQGIGSYGTESINFCIRSDQ